jgi:hypothetical protein
MDTRKFGFSLQDSNQNKLAKENPNLLNKDKRGQ